MRYLPGLSNANLFLLSGYGGIIHNPFHLLALLAGLVALLVGLLVSLFLGFLVMIIQIPSGGAGGRTHGQPHSGVTRDGPNHPTGCSADGSATQGALFGIRHARASNERQADYQDKNYR
jgi:hypothetical protein